MGSARRAAGWQAVAAGAASRTAGAVGFAAGTTTTISVTASPASAFFTWSAVSPNTRSWRRWPSTWVVSRRTWFSSSTNSKPAFVPAATSFAVWSRLEVAATRSLADRARSVWVVCTASLASCTVKSGSPGRTASPGATWTFATIPAAGTATARARPGASAMTPGTSITFG